MAVQHTAISTCLSLRTRGKYRCTQNLPLSLSPFLSRPFSSLLSSPPLLLSVFLCLSLSLSPTLVTSQVVLVVKNPPANAGVTRDMGSILGLGRTPGGRHDNPQQYSCLENSMDRRAWQAIVHEVAKGQTLLKQLSMHTSQSSSQV